MAGRKSAIPPLLEPYLRLPPESSLLLLTGVLNATPHWLIPRILRGAYGDSSGSRTATAAAARNRSTAQEEEGEDREEQKDEENGNGNVAVVLVSWLRDFEFWKQEARRGAGLDLLRLSQDDRFAFVDGLSSIFSTTPATPLTPAPTPQRTATTTTRPLSTSSLPQRGAPIPARTLPVRAAGPLPARGAAAPVSVLAPNAASQQQQQQQKNLFTLTSPSAPHALDTITQAITALSSSSASSTNRKVLLILDTPTTLLPLTLSTPSSITSTTLQSLVLALRAHPAIHATVLSLEIDPPFVSPATRALATQLPPSSPDSSSHAHSGGHGHGHDHDNGSPSHAASTSPLEVEMARFIVAQAHGARCIVGVRGLDTGVARDVSGVVRVTRGGAWHDYEHDYEHDHSGSRTHDPKHGRNNLHPNNYDDNDRESDLLYFVQTDGGVRVFERGGGDIG